MPNRIYWKDGQVMFDLDCSLTWTHGWLIGLLVASVSMLVGNKYVAQYYHSANLMILFQNGVALAILLGGNTIGRFKMQPFRREQFKQLLVPALLQSVQLLTSLKALPHVAVATTVVFRNISTLACAAIESTFLGAKYGNEIKASLLVIMLGALMYAYQDLNYNPVGYFWLTLNTCAYTVNNIYSKLTISKMDQSGDGVAAIQLIISIPTLFAYAIFFGEVPGGFSELFTLHTTAFFVFILLGLMGTLISLSYANLYKLVSATTVVVAANVNKIVSIILAYFVFGKPLTATQLLGLAICIAGGVAYSVFLKSMKKKPTAPQGKELEDPSKTDSV